MACRQYFPSDARGSNERMARPSSDVRQITSLPCRYLSLSEFIRDTRAIVHDILTSLLVYCHIVCSFWQSDETIAFAAGIDFILGSSIDLGGHDLFTIPRFVAAFCALAACGLVCMAKVGGKLDLCEEC